MAINEARVPLDMPSAVMVTLPPEPSPLGMYKMMAEVALLSVKTTEVLPEGLVDGEAGWKRDLGLAGCTLPVTVDNVHAMDIAILGNPEGVAGQVPSAFLGAILPRTPKVRLASAPAAGFIKENSGSIKYRLNLYAIMALGSGPGHTSA